MSVLTNTMTRAIPITVLAIVMAGCGALVKTTVVAPKCEGCDSLEIKPGERQIFAHGLIGPLPAIPLIPYAFHDICIGTEFIIRSKSNECPIITNYLGDEITTRKANKDSNTCRFANLCYNDGDTITLKTSKGVATVVYAYKSKWSYDPLMMY